VFLKIEGLILQSVQQICTNFPMIALWMMPLHNLQRIGLPMFYYWPNGKSSLHILFLNPKLKWKKNDDV